METSEKMIFTDSNLIECDYLDCEEIDIDVGTDNDFEIQVSVSGWDKRLSFESYVYFMNSEFGGIIKELESSTKQGMIFARGYTFRGMLANKVIEPPAGQDYRIVSGDINHIMRDLISEYGLADLFSVIDKEETVEISNFQFDRYVSLLSGMEKMLCSVGYRLAIAFVRDDIEKGYVRIQAVPIHDYSEEMELSNDGNFDFVVNEKRRGVNHLICLGKGELKERIVKHLYVQRDGSVGDMKHYTGLDEITEIYDYSSAEGDDLVEKGTERLKEHMNSKTFEPSVKENLSADYEIGDIIAGRDYITGITVRKPVIGKIYRYRNGEAYIEYKIEGDD